MPIVDVEIVGDESPKPSLSQELADAAGEIFGTPPGRTWIRLRMLPHDHYAENQEAQEHHPVFVKVLKGQWPEHDDMKQEITQLTEAFARICDRSFENVHVLYLPEGSGRIAFGGDLVGDD
jgi:phenylpyruvate tautomerase PptA (4-oxalocrotonate tautomerase family)